VASDKVKQDKEFPRSIGWVAQRQLASHGFTRFKQLARVKASDLQRIHRVGPRAIRIFGEELVVRGMRLATYDLSSRRITTV
jgi:predicted flap endonuclease-1-like 5' DNA nuclease